MIPYLLPAIGNSGEGYFATKHMMLFSVHIIENKQNSKNYMFTMFYAAQDLYEEQITMPHE